MRSFRDKCQTRMTMRRTSGRPRHRSYASSTTAMAAATVLWQLVLLIGVVAAETLQCNVSSTDQDSLERWTAATGLTFSRDSHAAAVFNDKIWIVGGVSTSYYTKRLEQTTTRSDVVSTEDGKTWTEVLEEGPFRRRFGHSLTAFKDGSDGKERLILLGGFSPEPATDVWTSLDGAKWLEVENASPWAGRGYHCTVSFKSRLWIMGGSPLNNEVWSTSSVISGPWEQQANVPWTPRSAHGCAAHKVITNTTQGESSANEYVFLMGGWDESSMQDVWRMDASGKWTLLMQAAPWDKRAWHSVVSFDSRTNGDIELGPRLWLIGGGIIGSGVHKMHPRWDVWYTRNGSTWIEASSDSSGVSTADWSMVTTREKQTCTGKWGQTVVTFSRKVSRSYYCSSSCVNEQNVTSLANQIIPVCDPTKMLPDAPAQKTILLKSSNSMVTRTIYPDGCGLCYGAASERYVNSTKVPALYFIAGNVGTQKIKDVFYSNDAMLCEKNGVICSNKGTCTLGGTCLCVSGKAGQFCEDDSPFTVIDGDNCFPPSARVTMRDGSQRPIGDIIVGDHVLTLDQTTGRLVFSVVYYLPHDVRQTTRTHYIRVFHTPQLSNDSNLDQKDLVGSLEITPLHLVYIVAPEWKEIASTTGLPLPLAETSASSIFSYLVQVSAQELALGDLLVSLSSNDSHDVSVTISRVAQLRAVRHHGAVTLYTMTGTIFVDGVLCSNFADLYSSPSTLLQMPQWLVTTQPAKDTMALTPDRHMELSGRERRRDAVPFVLFSLHRLLFTWLPFPSTAQLLKSGMELLVLPVLRRLWPRNVAVLGSSAPAEIGDCLYPHTNIKMNVK